MTRRTKEVDELEQARARNQRRLSGDVPDNKTPAHMAKLIDFRKSGKRPSRHKCAICLVVVSGRELHMDHCHQTGNLREFLCRKCNTGIGFFNDSIELLDRAMRYLQRHAVNKAAAIRDRSAAS